jgi:hypothetical protein
MVIIAIYKTWHFTEVLIETAVRSNTELQTCLWHMATPSNLTWSTNTTNTMLMLNTESHRSRLTQGNMYTEGCVVTFAPHVLHVWTFFLFPILRLPSASNITLRKFQYVWPPTHPHTHNYVITIPIQIVYMIMKSHLQIKQYTVFPQPVNVWIYS